MLIVKQKILINKFLKKLIFLLDFTELNKSQLRGHKVCFNSIIVHLSLLTVG